MAIPGFNPVSDCRHLLCPGLGENTGSGGSRGCEPALELKMRAARRTRPR